MQIIMFPVKVALSVALQNNWNDRKHQFIIYVCNKFEVSVGFEYIFFFVFV